jgi:hypothetical protein
MLSPTRLTPLSLLIPYSNHKSMATNTDEMASGSKSGPAKQSIRTDTDTESEVDSTEDCYSSPNSETSTHHEDLLSKDPFGSESSKLLFDAIDRLRDCGAGQDLELPQVSHETRWFAFF